MSEETLVYYISLIRKFVLLIISIFVIYHSILHVRSKRDSCQWLLQDGKLVADIKWQPFGCLLYNYNETDSKLCLRRKKTTLNNQHKINTKQQLIFMGDTRMLQLYHNTLEHIFPRTSYIPRNYNYSLFSKSIHHNTRYENIDLGLIVEFRWRPNPNAEMFQDFDNLLLSDNSDDNKIIDSPAKFFYNKSNNIIQTTNSTIERILVVGNSLWPTVNSPYVYDNQLVQYKTNMTRLLTHIKDLKSREKNTKILWLLQDPIDERKLSSTINITNAQIDKINDITQSLINTLSINDLYLVISLRHITKSFNSYMDSDGIHASSLILNHKVQILLNFICNKVFNFDSTCCTDLQPIELHQYLFISIATIIILAYVIQIVKPYINRDKSRIEVIRWQKVPLYDNTMTNMVEDDYDEDENQLSGENANDQDTDLSKINVYSSRLTNQFVVNEDLLINLAKFSTAILFMFICDRTNLFMKENKYFTIANFILPIVYVSALGIFFTESQSDTYYSRGILSRNQTYEWKGWMQLIVLIYNLSSASDNLRIYMLIRVLLSSYLFLVGFGHFTYFYKTGDISWKRFCLIILRMNLLSVCSSICMNKPYQYHYFVALVTFWLIVIFITMKIKPIKNNDRPTTNDHFWLLLKIPIVLGLITVLYMSEIFFSKIFLMQPWKFLFIYDNDDTTIKEWWKHWSVDRYTVIAGLIYGLFHWTIVSMYLDTPSYEATTTRNVACHSRESSQGSQDGLVIRSPLNTLQMYVKPKATYINTIAFIVLSFYILFAATCNDQSSCDEVHAYVSFVPIICYIVLRNGSEFLRNRHSSLFAFIGRISLELSICQYYIWLAANQRGLLVLVPNNPTLNLVVSSIIFITTAHKLHYITRKIIHYAIDLKLN